MDPGQHRRSGRSALKGLKLERLSIPKQAKTDLGLKHYLAVLKPQTDLDLADWSVTDTGLVHLKGLANLQRLDLNETEITDAGLVHLKGLTKLKSLSLAKTLITDAGLVHLKGLAKLEMLSLYGTKVTDAGVAELQKALPNCEISE